MSDHLPLYALRGLLRIVAVCSFALVVGASCTGGEENVDSLPGPDERPGSEDLEFGDTDDVPPADQDEATVEVGYEWEVLSSGAGGFVTGLDSNADGSVRLARTDVGGVYRWVDGEDRWQQLLSVEGVEGPTETDWQIEAMAIAPSDPDRLYLSVGDSSAEAEGSVLRSDDAGATWRRSPQQFAIHGNGDWRTSGERLSVDPNDADVVLLGTRTEGLWRSTDGGQSWTNIESVPSGSLPSTVNENATPAGVLFVVHGADGQSAYAGVSGSGVHRSVDGGLTWSMLIESEGMPFDAEVAADGRVWIVQRDPGAVFVIDGDGFDDVGPNGNRFETITVDPFDPERAIVGGVGIARDLWVTTNGGADWDDLEIVPRCAAIPWLEAYPLDFFPSGSMRFDRTAIDQVWVPEGFAVWKGPLTGEQIDLECTSEGIEELVSNDVIVPPGGRPVTAHWDRAIFWHGSTNAVDAVVHPAGRFNSAWDLDWSPADPSFLVAVIGDQRLCCRAEDDSFLSGYSTDGGQSWTPFGSYDDGGHPATLVYGNIAVAADDPNTIVWLPTFNGAVHVSRDRGDSWTPVILPGTDDLLSRTGAYAGGSHTQYFLNRKALVADRVEPGTFYLYHRFGLFRSTDGGSEWELQPSEGLPTGGIGQFGVQLVASPTEAGHLLFTPGPQGSGVPVPVYESRDAGATWQVLAGLSDVTAIGFGAPLAADGPSVVYVAGDFDSSRGIWRSTDGIATWELVSTAPMGNYQTVKALTGSLDEPGTVYVGYTGTSFMVGRFGPIGEG